MAREPTRDKSLSDLTVVDLEASAIWELTLVEKAVGPNEGQVRPRPDLLVHNSGVGSGAFVVRTRFTLADGSVHPGYCSPAPRDVEPPQHRLGYLAPAIITPSGQVPFWLVVEREPQPGDVVPYYRMLDRDASAVFPVAFDVDVPVRRDEVAAGEISDFHFLVLGGASAALTLVKLR